MSNLSSYSLIDDDHIDDQETINVGNLIIDLESDLEKEKFENEQQAHAKPTTSTTINNTPTSTFATKATPSSSSSSSSNNNNATSANSTSNNINSSSTKSKSNRHSTQHTTAAAAASSNNNNIVNSSSATGAPIAGASITNSNNNTPGAAAAAASTTTNNCSANPGLTGAATKRTVFKSSADERGELKMRITRETKPGKSEHKIVTSPNQKSPTSCSSSSSNTNCGLPPTSSQPNININNGAEDTTLSLPASKPSQSSSSISSTKECGTSTSIGTITEPDCLGPCEPGTSVTLEGIVWQETEGGILVVNITWRGKTYVGSLLDCTKHDWAPPRLCDSPASDIDSKAHKGVRTKRIVTRSNGIGLDEKNLLQTTGKLRNGKGRRILNDPGSCNKRQRESEKSDNSANQPETMSSSANVSSITNSENTCVAMNVDTVPGAATNESILTINNSEDAARPTSPVLISCNELNCSKKFRNLNGLQYHKAHAHGAENDLNNAHDSNSCSSSAKPSIKEDNEDESKEATMETENIDSNSEDNKQHHNNKDEVVPVEQNRTPSPHLSVKMSGKVSPETSYQKTNSNNVPIANSNMSNTNSINNNMNFINPGPPPPPPVSRDHELDRRNLPTYMNPDQDMRSPLSGGPKLGPEYLPLPGNSSSSKSMANMKPTATTSGPQPPPPPPSLPATSEEGIKPSGTSTGPPPAPHQANCYFNPTFLANTYNPYLASYFPRSPLPMYDPLAPPTSSANAAFLSRFMSTMRVPPPPDSPSKLMNPAAPKNPLSFPPFKMDPGMPMPNPPMTNPPLLGMTPLPNPPMMPGSPHLRMPGHNDPIMPPTSQPPFPLPMGMNPVLGLPGPPNSLGPLGGPQVPSLVDDPLAKQFPRRFN